jgi:hypothetical protein
MSALSVFILYIVILLHGYEQDTVYLPFLSVRVSHYKSIYLKQWHDSSALFSCVRLFCILSSSFVYLHTVLNCVFLLLALILTFSFYFPRISTLIVSAFEFVFPFSLQFLARCSCFLLSPVLFVHFCQFSSLRFVLSLTVFSSAFLLLCFGVPLFIFTICFFLISCIFSYHLSSVVSPSASCSSHIIHSAVPLE